MGSTVTIRKDGDDATKKCKIVGSEEADMSSGRISNECPLGVAILGKKIGENFLVDTPKGKVSYMVVSIDKNKE